MQFRIRRSSWYNRPRTTACRNLKCHSRRRRLQTVNLTTYNLYRGSLYRNLRRGLSGGLTVMRRYKDIPLWKNVSPKQWTDWKWQGRDRTLDGEAAGQR